MQVHPLLLEPASAARRIDDAESIGLVDRQVEASVFDMSDPELEPLLQQFGSHLESILANGEQIEGLEEAISTAHAALNPVLSR
jgi:kinetochore protein Fta7